MSSNRANLLQKMGNNLGRLNIGKVCLFNVLNQWSEIPSAASWSRFVKFPSAALKCASPRDEGLDEL